MKVFFQYIVILFLYIKNNNEMILLKNNNQCFIEKNNKL